MLYLDNDVQAIKAILAVDVQLLAHGELPDEVAPDYSFLILLVELVLRELVVVRGQGGVQKKPML